MTVKNEGIWRLRILIAIGITGIACLNGCAELLFLTLMSLHSTVDVGFNVSIDMIRGALTVGSSILGVLVMIYLISIFSLRYRNQHEK